MSARDPASVRAMFDRLAPRYDLLNTLLSGGQDGRWRRRTAAAARLGPGDRALDVACGSGRLTRELFQRAPRGLVVGLDFSPSMIEVARARLPGPAYIRGDALNLPFAAGRFDAVTVAFGLRNFADPELGLREMLRVLRAGGRAVVLEFLRPGEGVAGRTYRTYLRHAVPRIGGLVSGQPRAYRYLSDTVDGYHSADELVDLAGRAGWRSVRLELLTLATVGLLAGQREHGDNEGRGA